MNAAELTRALAGRWTGSSGVARCPSHDDKSPSLSISQGQDGKILVRCHAGCEQDSVISGLKARDLWSGATRSTSTTRRTTKAKPSPEPSPNQAPALDIWRVSRDPVGTLTADYLLNRAIAGKVPASIRDHPGLKHGPTGLNLPAMVAAITGADRKVIAIQRTFLRLDGAGKANVSDPKMTLGAMRDGAVRLAAAGPVLGIAEGVETGLSAMELFGVPVWCSLSCSRLDRLYLPPEALEIHVFADNGTPGLEAADRAAKAYPGQGRRVVLRFPPEQFGDWNDALAAGEAA